MDPYDWDEDQSEGAAGRPRDVKLAINLLAGSVTFNMIMVFELWSRFGLDRLIADRRAWIRPAVLVAWAVLLVLMWRGSTWARNLVLLAIGWDVLGFVSAASLLFAIGGNRMLGILSWVNLVLELFAVYLLMQEESLDWFRRQS